MTELLSCTQHSSLIAVLGDQLSMNTAALRAGDRNRDTSLMAEVMEEARYVRHHKKGDRFRSFRHAPFRGGT